jgi:hypothetical protein
MYGPDCAFEDDVPCVVDVVAAVVMTSIKNFLKLFM